MCCTYDVPAESPWEIGITDKAEGGTDGTVKELPHIIKVTGFQFTPIHNFIPKKQTLSVFNTADQLETLGRDDNNTYGPQRYIALANGTEEKDSNYNIYDTTNNIKKPPKNNAPPPGAQRANAPKLGGATPTIANPINLPNNFTGI